jgi:hypothetical protein
MNAPIDRFAREYAFLSNFYPSEVDYPSRADIHRRTYPTVEHAFQAAKTDDYLTRRSIRRAPTPQAAKRLGRQVALRSDWEDVKVRVMRGLVLQKFVRHDDLGAKLLATTGRELVEGNTWGDRFWGVCGGQGLNHLGHILMEVRAHLAGRRDAVG